MQKADGGDFPRSLAKAVLQLLMGADVDGLIGAGRHERGPERVRSRNGYRDRSLDTRLGSLQLRIPTLRQGSYFPPFLELRKTSEPALVAIIQEAWTGGISTKRVDDLVQAMGLSGISKSQVSKPCKGSDERVNAAKDRSGLFDGQYFTPGEETGRKILEWLNSGAEVLEPEPPVMAGQTGPKVERKHGFLCWDCLWVLGIVLGTKKGLQRFLP